jgi:hypothetical protein
MPDVVADVADYVNAATPTAARARHASRGKLLAADTDAVLRAVGMVMVMVGRR